jgi:N-acetyl-gamma-glutamyl-phosphate reductase
MPVPEIEQGLSEAAESKVTISFTPNLICMKRGMQSTMFVEMAPGVTANDLYQHLKSTYEVCCLIMWVKLTICIFDRTTVFH